MSKGYRKFLRLTWPERRLLLSTLAILAGVKIGLRVARFERVQHIVGWLERRSMSGRRPPCITPAQVLWALNAASRRVPGGHNCLARALAAKLLLQRHGYPSRLHIGVARSPEGAFEAHAWLERQGVVLVGGLKDLARYTPLPGFDREVRKSPG